MSIRVIFSLGSPDGLLTHFLNAPLDRFLAWYEEALAKFPEDFKPGSLSILQRIVHEGRAGLEAVDAWAPDVVDDLLGWYYRHFAAVYPWAELMPASDTLLSYWRFQTLEETFHQTGKKAASRLLAHLAIGRPILGGPARTPRLTPDDTSRLSYWTAADALQLWQMLEAFGQEERLILDPDRGALPAIHEAVSAAVRHHTGVIIDVN